MTRLRRHTISFRNAFRGLYWAFTTQPNFLVHAAATSIAILAGLYFSLTRLEWLILIFTISLVFIVEMLNTSLEVMTDLINKKYSPEAKIAKDVSAAMVLLTAGASLIIAAFLFLPRLLF